jgi:hypothetical protein
MNMTTDSVRPLARGDHTCKRRGEIAELAFMYKAASLGFGVAKPYGDNERYDFILDSGQRLWRMQIKSTAALRDGAYYINAQRRLGKTVEAYTAAEIDFLVAHIVPEDAWYVIPVAALMQRTTIRIYLHSGARGEFRAYREAWQQLTKAKARP